MYDLNNKTQLFCNKKNRKHEAKNWKHQKHKVICKSDQNIMIFTSQDECHQGYNNKQPSLAGHRFARGLLQVKTENINFVK